MFWPSIEEHIITRLNLDFDLFQNLVFLFWTWRNLQLFHQVERQGMTGTVSPPLLSYFSWQQFAVAFYLKQCTPQTIASLFSKFCLHALIELCSWFISALPK